MLSNSVLIPEEFRFGGLSGKYIRTPSLHRTQQRVNSQRQTGLGQGEVGRRRGGEREIEREIRRKKREGKKERKNEDQVICLEDYLRY